MNKIPMTADGYNRLQEELKRLKTVDRPSIIRAIAEARDHGDLAENAEYHSARDRQSLIEGRLEVWWGRSRPAWWPIAVDGRERVSLRSCGIRPVFVNPIDGFPRAHG